MKSSSQTGITLLFTDIEGSTRLWEQEPVRMQPALALHDMLCRTAVEASHGTVVKITGDGMYAAFDNPVNALRATMALQSAVVAATGGEWARG